MAGGPSRLPLGLWKPDYNTPDGTGVRDCPCDGSRRGHRQALHHCAGRGGVRTTWARARARAMLQMVAAFSSPPAASRCCLSHPEPRRGRHRRMLEPVHAARAQRELGWHAAGSRRHVRRRAGAGSSPTQRLRGLPGLPVTIFSTRWLGDDVQPVVTHRRFSPLTGRYGWSPHRAKAPLAVRSKNKPGAEPVPRSGLLPLRRQQARHRRPEPDYQDTFVFTSGFAALMQDTPAAGGETDPCSETGGGLRHQPGHLLLAGSRQDPARLPAPPSRR